MLGKTNLLPLLVVTAVAIGCGARPLKTLDSPCTTDTECGSDRCRYGKCTRTCTAQGDCPQGFDCGLQQPADGLAGGLGASCYKSTFDPTPASSGGFGADCAVFSPDPTTGTACDPMASNPCADGFTCLAALRCDPLAYCTRNCTSDANCPPNMFCGADAGGPCTSDADCKFKGWTCQAPPGGSDALKVCVGPSLCLKRTQCSSCGTDDQCPAGYACATDAGGERFCGKLCTLDEHCPQPQNDSEGSPISSPFQKCVPATDGSAVTVCRPTAGYCHGPSAVADLMTTQNTVCSPCRVGMPGDCPTGFCNRGDFSLEAFCTQPCTAHVQKEGSFYTVTNDSCPMGTHCYAAAQCSSCDVKGLCTGDTNPQNLGRAPLTYTALTCYPLQ